MTNRLIYEKSPYLLQHAENPVDWYPWGKEAFDLAKKLNKPIFLSIGYATCHWCHVMEKESFCDRTIASVLNETFVCIKVDREELPEVDGLYMEIAQVLMSSKGGWPLNVILTPDLKPFYATTYLPPINSHGLMGLKEVSLYIQSLWQGQEQPRLLAQADEILDFFKEAIALDKGSIPSAQLLKEGIDGILVSADTIYGGKKGFPKFPMSYQLEFLLQYSVLFEDERSLSFIDLTLDMMSRGGIYDHLGGGFSRYSVDDKWVIPHFEKMLYDNAILSKTYLEVFRYSKKEHFKKIVIETLDYLQREMSHKNEGFYAAEDADVEGREGVFYTWGYDEVEALLQGEEKKLFLEYFNLTKEGNFDGKNVLYASQSIEEFASGCEKNLDEVKATLDQAKKTLIAHRNKRARPFKDDKMITSWNALAIESFIHAGHAFGRDDYIQIALDTAEFIKKHLYKERKLLRRYREQEAKFEANLEDYAYLIRALLSLYQFGHGQSFLEWAKELSHTLKELFRSELGGFYFTPYTSDLIVRKCDFHDGSEPSGNAIHADNLLRLYQITKDPYYKLEAEEIFEAGEKIVSEYPQGASGYFTSLLRYLDHKAITMIVILDEEETLKQEIISFVAESYLPHLTLVWRSIDQNMQDGKILIDGQTAVYICDQTKCLPPFVLIEDIKQSLFHSF